MECFFDVDALPASWCDSFVLFNWQCFGAFFVIVVKSFVALSCFWFDARHNLQIWTTSIFLCFFEVLVLEIISLAKLVFELPFPGHKWFMCYNQPIPLYLLNSGVRSSFRSRATQDAAWPNWSYHYHAGRVLNGLWFCWVMQSFQLLLMQLSRLLLPTVYCHAASLYSSLTLS